MIFDLGKRDVKVILDTNFLMLLGQGIDIFTGVEDAMQVPFKFYVVDKTFVELRKIIESGGEGNKESMDAKLAFVLAKQKRLAAMKGKEKLVDDDIVRLCKGHYVATLDRELKKRVKAAGAKVITFKQKKVAIEG